MKFNSFASGRNSWKIKTKNKKKDKRKLKLVIKKQITKQHLAILVRKERKTT